MIEGAGLRASLRPPAARGPADAHGLITVSAAAVLVAFSLGLTGFAAPSFALMLLPWRWHHRFAQWAIPMVIRHLRLYSLMVAALAGLLVYAIFFG